MSWKVSEVINEVPRAPKEGAILGAAVCGAGHVVLVMGNFSNRPIIECHMDPEQVEMVIAMLRAALAAVRN